MKWVRRGEQLEQFQPSAEIIFVGLGKFSSRNLDKSAFQRELKRVAAAYESDKFKILFLTIMTHGNENGVLYCSDGKTISVGEILGEFTHIEGKPKVLSVKHGRTYDRSILPFCK